METLHSIFKEVRSSEPGADFEGRILQAVISERNRKIRQEERAAYAGMVFSAVAAVIAGLGYGSDLIHSDFWNIFSLLFSDASVVANYWDSFSLSLLETFPVSAIAVLLAPVFVFLVSVGAYSKLEKNRQQSHYYA